MNQGNWQSSWLGDSMAFNARKRTCLMMMMMKNSANFQAEVNLPAIPAAEVLVLFPARGQ